MGDNLHRSFALLIAQVLPGLIVVLGVTPHSPALQQWLGAAAAADITIGGTVMVILLAITCSMILNGVRCQVFERALGIEQKCVGDGLRSAPRKTATVEEEDDLMVHHYAYYQFYGSTAIAWPLVVVLNVGTPVTWPVKIGTLLLAMLIEYVLFVSAWDAMHRYLEKKVALVQGQRPT